MNLKILHLLNKTPPINGKREKKIPQPLLLEPGQFWNLKSKVEWGGTHYVFNPGIILILAVTFNESDSVRVTFAPVTSKIAWAARKDLILFNKNILGDFFAIHFSHLSKTLSCALGGCVGTLPDPFKEMIFNYFQQILNGRETPILFEKNLIQSGYNLSLLNPISDEGLFHEGLSLSVQFLEGV